MKTLKYIIIITLILFPVISYSAEVSVSTRLGYSPAVGGSMSSGWQKENLGAFDGINSINSSSDTLAVSTVKVPTALIAGADLRIISEYIYFRTGIEYLYQNSGGEGSTLNPAGTEVVNVTYSQWSFDVPLTMGVSILFWGETRVYMGAGAAYACGTYSNSFKSASLNHSGSFTGSAFPLVAEFGCEYLLNEKVIIGCDIKHLSGKSKVITDGTDYARVDFTGFHITASAALYFNL